ncbi:zinc-dependent peptidase [Bacteroidota bacterium]
MNIIGKQDFKITSEVKLFVVAAHVQLTLGFSQYILPKFRTILIYPDAYENKMTGKMHYGEVNPRGVIVLSWKRLVKGHVIPDDKVNLGLHEMAHALMHTIIQSNDHEYGLDPYLKDIVRLSQSEMEKIKSNDHHFFRKYAGTNIYEFFAIAIEYFFEVPAEFRKELPILYQYLVNLLKQDPVQKIFRK